ncbi:MAG: CHASE2 domain-containing protein, partial [Leptolyngbya sp. SIO4C1]|nr:CHASE2 domain-containing protein [Leptolyngbya sp. SIO4C1]
TEVHTLKRLGEHRGIPKLLDSFEDEQEFYLVQEFIDGEPLSQEIKRTGRFSEAQVIDLLREALAILQFVHENRVLHRDIKPDNLMRRRCDGRFVLIDFGAVKEIRTQLVSGEVSNLTVGIGTQGYTPSEQLAGKPRYSSDIFALGMTAIHALTGRLPTDLPEETSSLELHWQTYAEVSPGLAILLKKMVRHYFYQRYQGVDEVLKDLDRLDQLPEEVSLDDFPQTYLPLQTLWQPTWRESLRAAAIATVAVAGLCLGLRQIGAFVPVELLAYDWLLSHRSDPGPDPRLLIVEITEQDLNRLQSDIPSDQVVADAIDILQTHEPATIGLDLHRNIPQGAGRAALSQSLQADNVIGITKVGDGADDAIPPPPELSPYRVGFNDFPIDPDSKIRRSLQTFLSEGEAFYSFGLVVALHYLEQTRGLIAEAHPDDPDIMLVGEAEFAPIDRSFGGYQQIEAEGYQIMLDYRSPRQVAERLTLTEVLSQDFDPALVTDKIVLIGTTAYVSLDKFFTPYSLLSGDSYEMHGVIIHAHIVSQILSAVLDERSLIWAWPDWLEITWTIVCAGAGGLLIWRVRSPLRRWLVGLAGGSAIVATSVLFFSMGAWVPLGPPLSAFVLSGSSLLAYRRYRQRQPAQSGGY